MGLVFGQLTNTTVCICAGIVSIRATKMSYTKAESDFVQVCILVKHWKSEYIELIVVFVVIVAPGVRR